MHASQASSSHGCRVSHRTEHFVALLSVHFDLLDMVTDKNTWVRLCESLILLPIEDHREQISADVEERFDWNFIAYSHFS